MPLASFLHITWIDAFSLILLGFAVFYWLEALNKNWGLGRKWGSWVRKSWYRKLFLNCFVYGNWVHAFYCLYRFTSSAATVYEYMGSTKFAQFVAFVIFCSSCASAVISTVTQSLDDSYVGFSSLNFAMDVFVFVTQLSPAEDFETGILKLTITTLLIDHVVTHAQLNFVAHFSSAVASFAYLRFLIKA